MVKRFKQPAPPEHIKPFRSRFSWKKCEACSYEFRREWIWEVGCRGSTYFVYFCGRCCPTWQMVSAKLARNVFPLQPPKAPPPPARR